MNIKSKRINFLVVIMLLSCISSAQELSFPTNKKGNKYKNLKVYEVFKNEDNIGFQLPFSPEKGEDKGYLLSYVEFTPDGKSLHFTYGSRFNIIDIDPTFKFREGDQSILYRNLKVPIVYTSLSYNNNQYYTDGHNYSAKIFKQKNDLWSPLPDYHSFNLVINDRLIYRNRKEIWITKYKCSDLGFDKSQNENLRKNKENFEVFDVFDKGMLNSLKNDAYQNDNLITLSLENSYLAQIEDAKYYTEDMAVEDGADLLLAALLTWNAKTDSKPILRSIAYIDNINMLFCSYNNIPSIVGYNLKITGDLIEFKNEKAEAFLHGHTTEIIDMFTDPSGRYLVSWSERETILWDFQEELTYKISQDRAFKPLAFSPTKPVLVLSKLSSLGTDKINIVLFDINEKVIIKDGIPLNSSYEIDYKNAYKDLYSRSIDANFVHDASFSVDGTKLSIVQTFTMLSKESLPSVAEVPGPVQNIFVLDFEKLLGVDYRSSKLVKRYKESFNIHLQPYLLPIATSYDEYLTNNLGKVDKKGEFEKTIDYERRATKTNLKNSLIIQSKWEDVNFEFTSKDKFNVPLKEIKKYDADTEIYRAVLKGELPVMIKIPPNEASEFKSSWWESATINGEIIRVESEPNKYERLFLSAPSKERKFPVKVAVDSKSFFSLSAENN